MINQTKYKYNSTNNKNDVQYTCNKRVSYYIPIKKLNVVAYKNVQRIK